MKIEWTARASRDMNNLAVEFPKVASAVVELIYGDLSKEPRRVGRPLRFSLEGLHAARRAEYRIVYEIGEDEVIIHRVAPRSTVYRR